MKTSSIAYVFLVSAAIIFGAIFSVNKSAAAADVPPLTYGFWQSFAAGTLLSIIIALRVKAWYGVDARR